MEGSGAGLSSGSRTQASQRYQPVKVLRQGLHSNVILARDLSSGELVAFKQIARRQLRAGQLGEDAVLAALQLHHPHLLALQEVGLTNEFLVLVMGQGASSSLADWLAGAGAALAGPGSPGGEAIARWLMAQVFFALDYAHSLGCCFGSLTPNTILVAGGTPARPIIKLADMNDVADPSSAGAALVRAGCPGHLAPEALTFGLSGLGCDPRAQDMWSAGVLLYSLLTGRNPSERAGDVVLGAKRRLRTQLQRTQRASYVMPTAISPACQDLLSKLLTADPSRRLTASQALAHPWCCAGDGLMEAGPLLHFNRTLMANALAQPPRVDLVAQVQAILREAALRPGRAGAAAAPVPSRHSCCCAQPLVEDAVSTLDFIPNSPESSGELVGPDSCTGLGACEAEVGSPASSLLAAA